MQTAGAYLLAGNANIIEAYDRPRRLMEGSSSVVQFNVDDFGHCEWRDTARRSLGSIRCKLIHVCPNEPCIYTFPKTALEPIRILELRRRNPNMLGTTCLPGVGCTQTRGPSNS